MISGLKNVIMGIVAFVLVNAVLASTVMTGTDVGTTLLKALLGLVVAFAVIIGAFQLFKGK
jgi:hypothetical protein